MHQSLYLRLLNLGWRSGPSRCPHKAELHVRIVPPERLRRLMTGRLLVEQYGASLNLVVAASFAGVRYVGLADALSRH